jgi:peptidoglycan/LPS O-acetylase OafA/YrhL
MTQSPAGAPPPSRDARAHALSFIEPVKGLALLWIVLNHLVERSFGFPLLGNPGPDWPPLGERVAQLRPLLGHGLLDLPLNVLRYAGWTGDAGVQIFLMLSGLGLTYGALRRPRPALDFYRRRLLRIFPPWWAAHLIFLLPLWLRLGSASPADPALYLSLLGIRVTPALFSYMSYSWWYVGLLLQLYLAFPLLLHALRRLGPLGLLLPACAVSLLARALGLAFLEGYQDPFLRGALLVTRLPEFALGMCLGHGLLHAPERWAARLRGAGPCALGALLFALGTALSLGRAGMVVAPLLTGAGALPLLIALSCMSRGWERPLGWLGRRSYGLYLAHQPLIMLLVPRGLERGPLRILGGMALALLCATLVGLLLERAGRAAGPTADGRPDP